jgi:hypothetical protein
VYRAAHGLCGSRQDAEDGGDQIDEIQAPVDPIGETLDGAAVYTALQDLSRPLREALVAVDIVGLSYREAANALGTKEGTIVSRLTEGVDGSSPGWAGTADDRSRQPRAHPMWRLRLRTRSRPNSTRVNPVWRVRWCSWRRSRSGC